MLGSCHSLHVLLDIDKSFEEEMTKIINIQGPQQVQLPLNTAIFFIGKWIFWNSSCFRSTEWNNSLPRRHGDPQSTVSVVFYWGPQKSFCSHHQYACSWGIGSQFNKSHMWLCQQNEMPQLWKDSSWQGVIQDYAISVTQLHCILSNTIALL